MECFSNKGGCGICGHCMYIEVLKKELAQASDKQLQVNSNVMLFKTVIPLYCAPNHRARRYYYTGTKGS